MMAERLHADDVDVLAVDLEPMIIRRDSVTKAVPFAADLTTRDGNRDAVDAALEHFAGST